MERVETLCNRLREQVMQKASPDELLLTVQMLQSEILHVKMADNDEGSSSSVAINMPSPYEQQAQQKPIAETEEKIVEVLKIDEAEVEAELEEIKKNAEARSKIASNKPPLLFDPVEDTPTLTHQHQQTAKGKKEVHETLAPADNASLNEKLKQSQTELSDTLQEVPIKDLKKAIGINDRFQYITELFRGDEVMYERSIKTINSFAIYPEAEYWIKRELKLKLGWDDKTPVVKQFDQLVKRRFAVI